METMDIIEPTQPLMNVKTFNSQEEFLDNIKSIPYISGGLDDLANSQTAIIYFNAASCRPKCVLPCSSLFNCNFSDLGDTFIYNTLLVNNGELKYLYKSIGRLDCKICACNLFNKFTYVKSSNLGSYNEVTEQNINSECVEMLKETKCFLLGMCTAFFPVNVKPDGNTIGFVRYKGPLEPCCQKVCGPCIKCCTCDGKCDFNCGECCKKACSPCIKCFTCACFKNCNCKCDFNCEACCKKACFPCIKCCGYCKICFTSPISLCYNYYYVCDACTPDKQPVYTILLKRCSLSFIPTDCCDSLSFVIRNVSGSDVGQIEVRKATCIFNGFRQKNCTYTIKFPPDASPELKLTIINAVYSIDMFIL